MRNFKLIYVSSIAFSILSVALFLQLAKPNLGSASHTAPGAWVEGKGQLFGTCLLLDEMVRRAMKFMEVSFPQAVAMASLHPARTLGLEKERGSLEPGRLADLVVWDKEHRPVETVIRGNTVWKAGC